MLGDTRKHVPSVDAEVVRRIKSRKAHRRLSERRYRDRASLAFVVHSFNRIQNVAPLVAGLRRMGDHELVVCDDGSLDGSREKWLSHLTRPNDFLIHSNDIHEIRILDRAIRFASADIICLVQDDDVIPRGTSWLANARRHFRGNPQLAILGGFMGFDSFDPDPKRAKRLWGRTRFRFVQHVNIGPYFVRKQHYEALGGWDYSFSRAGEPGICFDNELCLRAWVKGYQVGYSFVPFKGPAGHYSLDGGTMLFGSKARRRNQLRNQQKIYEMYMPRVRLINRRVREANRVAGLSDGVRAGGPPNT